MGWPSFWFSRVGVAVPGQMVTAFGGSGAMPTITVRPAPAFSRLPLSSTARVRIVYVPVCAGVQT